MVLPLEKMRWDSGVMNTIRSTSSALPEPARTLGSLGWRGKMRSANDRAVPTRCALVLFQGGPRMFELHADDIAVIAGADGPNAIGIWANSHRDRFIRHLPSPGGIPSHDTIGRLLAALLTTETTFYHSIWSVPGRCSLESVLGSWRRMQSRTKSQRFQH